MAQLSNKIIAYLGRTPDFLTEVKLQNDGSGDYIKEWNISSEKPKPTDDQLNALDSQATTLENNNKVDEKDEVIGGSSLEAFRNIIKNEITNCLWWWLE